MESLTKENVMPVDEFKKEVIGGVITGQIAGLIMAVVVMIVFTLLGAGPFFPVQVIGSMALGESALTGLNLIAVFVGVLLHQLGPSLLWGLVYGLMASGLKIKENPKALYLGLAVGILSMIGPYLLIPTLMNAFHGTDYWNQNVPIFWDWAAHIVFGASFGLFPGIVKKLTTIR